MASLFKIGNPVDESMFGAIFDLTIDEEGVDAAVVDAVLFGSAVVAVVDGFVVDDPVPPNILATFDDGGTNLEAMLSSI